MKFFQTGHNIKGDKSTFTLIMESYKSLSCIDFVEPMFYTWRREETASSSVKVADGLMCIKQIPLKAVCYHSGFAIPKREMVSI